MRRIVLAGAVAALAVTVPGPVHADAAVGCTVSGRFVADVTFGTCSYLPLANLNGTLELWSDGPASAQVVCAVGGTTVNRTSAGYSFSSFVRYGACVVTLTAVGGAKATAT